MPLTIFHYIRSTRLEDGGIVRCVIDNCTLAKQLGHNVILATTTLDEQLSPWLSSTTAPELLLVTQNRAVKACLDRQSIKSISLAIQSSDLLFFHDIWSPELLQLARIARIFSKPYIMPIYGSFTPWAMEQKRWKKIPYLAIAGRHLLRNAQLIQVVSEVERTQTKHWASGVRTVLAPYLLNIDSPHSPSTAAQGGSTSKTTGVKRTFTFLFLSRFHKKKGIETLIYASRELRKRGYIFKTLIAGTGDPQYTKYLKDQVSTLGLAHEIRFCGPVFGVAKSELFTSVDAFILPSWSENFGLVLVEAMAAGLPVITTFAVDIWPFLKSGGAIIAKNHPDSLADSMEEIITTPQLQLANNASRSKEWVASHFSFEARTKLFTSLIRMALSPPSNQTSTEDLVGR